MSVQSSIPVVQVPVSGRFAALENSGMIEFKEVAVDKGFGVGCGVRVCGCTSTIMGSICCFAESVKLF